MKNCTQREIENNETMDLKRVQKKSPTYVICEPILKEITQMSHDLNLSQKELEDRSGIKQQMIARFESGINTPNMSTVLKLLAAFGKTLCICSMKDAEHIDGADVVTEDMFCSESNMEHLSRGVESLNAGKGEEHEPIEADDE